MLVNPIELQASENIDFFEAKDIADQKAKELDRNPMLLAWFDGHRGKHSPDVVCGCGDKPSWLVYAQNRGGFISVDINKEKFVFVYRSGDFN
jgi:hypothetical protein